MAAVAAPGALAAPCEYGFRAVEDIAQDQYFDALVRKGRAAYDQAIGELSKVAGRIKEHTQRWDARNLTLVAGTVTEEQQAELKRDAATYSLEREKREQARKLIRELEATISECEPVEETPDIQAFKRQLARLKIDLRGVESAHNDLFVTARNDLVAKKAAVEKVLAAIEENWVNFRTSFEQFNKHVEGYTGVLGFVAHQTRRALSMSWAPLALKKAAEQDATTAGLTE